ncbi:MAG: hypothetical protein J6P20_00340, partial [Oscillospiraceae bacterium]|nr:hypothetical protein [Oscillospiraceae bacterium]
RGFPLSELDDWNTGMVIDWIMEKDRIIRRQRGERVEDPYEQYLQLKEMEPDIEEMYKAGQIREQKYQSYRSALERCEEQIRR